MTDMKTYSRIFTAFAVCLCLVPLGAIAVDATEAGEENKEEVFSVPKPRTQDQFDRDMEALHRQYGGDTAAYSAKYAEEERKWKAEVAEYNDKVRGWNESHADSPQSTITIEDDSGVDGNDEISDDWENENDNEGDIKFGNFKKGDEEKLLEMYGDTGYEDKEEYKNDDGSKIEDDHQENVSDEEIDSETRKAKNQDADDLGDLIEDWAGKVWADSAVAAEGAVKAKAESMINTGAKKIQDNFFSTILESLPFFNDHKDAYEKMVGYARTETVTEQKTTTQNMTMSGMSAYGGRSFSWTISIPKTETYTREIEVHEKGLIDEEIKEEDDPNWKWDELSEAPDYYLDEENFNAFDWNYGGFKGGDSVWGGDPGNGSGPVIGNLKIGKDGLSFNYENGLAGWGLEDDDYSGALACLFVQDKDGNWVGGKFDWISTSRRTRDFTNIYNGYNGWDLSNVPKTTTAAFVIVSKDGKWRSNVITALWER